MTLPLLALDFDCRLLSPARLPAFKGSTLRGAFGHALKRVACALKRQDCASCLLAGNCAYSLIFATEKLDASRLSARPHPYVLNPPATDQLQYREGDCLSFNLVLLGPATQFLPHVVCAVEAMGQKGIGSGTTEGAGRFALHRVTMGEQPAQVLYTEEDRMLRPPDNPPCLHLEAGAPGPAGELGLGLLTPLRLKDQNSLQSALPFSLLIRAALRRVSTLEEHYGSGRPALDYHALVMQAGAVESVQADTRWQEIKRYSNRQKREMLLGGMVGRLRFRGHISVFLPLLRYAEAVNLGKQTVFGLGRIRIVEPA